MTREIRGQHRLLFCAPGMLRHSINKADIEVAIKKTANPERYAVLEVELPVEALV